jgi:hypothetical protein
MAKVLPSSAAVVAGFEVYEEFRDTPAASAKDCCDSPRAWRRARMIAPRATRVWTRVSDVMTSSLTAFHEATEP